MSYIMKLASKFRIQDLNSKIQQLHHSFMIWRFKRNMLYMYKMPCAQNLLSSKPPLKQRLQRELFHKRCFFGFSDRSVFTDDSVLTIALADTILTGRPYAENLKRFFHWYPHAGYGGSFSRWAQAQDSAPYNSWGNGSAMRVSPVGWAFDTVEKVLAEAETSAAV